MRLVMISDTHCLHEQVVLPEGDVLIHGGDFCGWGTSGEFLQFNNWLLRQPFQHKLVVAGNHDRVVQESRSHCEFFLRQVGATYLQDSGVTIDGVRFWGAPWTPEFLSWSFMKKRGADIDERWALIPEGLDVLIVHGPPHDILDATESGDHVGCEMMAKRLQNGLKPRLFVCGHNHAGYGRLNKDGVWYVNAAQTNEPGLGKPYEVTHLPIAYDLVAERVMA